MCEEKFNETQLYAVAYLEFHEEGAKFSLATSAYTKGGAKPCFPTFTFFPMAQKNLLAKGGHDPMAPLNTPLVICSPRLSWWRIG